MDENIQHLLNLPQVSQSLDFTCGAACFACMHQYFFKESYGELYFAEKLGTLKLGYTAPESIVDLAKEYSLHSELKIGSKFDDLTHAFFRSAVVFVTWWDEDAGHYSLVKSIESKSILLMDPWSAREGKDKRLALEEFQNYWDMRGRKMISVRRNKEIGRAHV